MNILECELEDIRLNEDEPLFFDSETCGFYKRIRLAQFFQEGWDGVLLVNNPNPFELTLLLDKIKVVMQNGHYDITTIQAQTNSRYEPKDYEDTLYLARLHFYNKDRFSLDKTMKYVLGYDPYEKAGIDKKLMQKINWDIPVLTTTQKLYAAIDVYYLPQVYNDIKAHIDDTSYKLDMLATQYALDFQNNGMPVIASELQKLYASNIAEIEKYNLPINVNSYVQVRPYIGSKNSDALGLATLALSGNERAKEVNTVRKLIKQNSFLNKFDNDEGRIYGKFLPSARSGRFTSKDQNLQQIPRKTKCVFGYDTEAGRVLSYSDYAQLEMRCIAAITGEPVMAKLLRAMEDLHDYTATMLFGKGFTPTQRQIAKTCNFNLLYGGGANMLGSILIKDAGILLSEFELKSIKRKWRNLYAVIAAWQDKGMEDWRHGRPWATPFGRKYTAKLPTDQLNIINQGFGSEVAKLAMHYMEPEIKSAFGGDVFLANFIHDSYIYDCPNDEEVYEGVAIIVADAMQKGWKEACRTGKDLKVRDLPMPVTVYTGYNWGRIESDYLHKYEAA